MFQENKAYNIVAENREDGFVNLHVYNGEKADESRRLGTLRKSNLSVFKRRTTLGKLAYQLALDSLRPYTRPSILDIGVYQSTIPRPKLKLVSRLGSPESEVVVDCARIKTDVKINLSERRLNLEELAIIGEEVEKIAKAEAKKDEGILGAALDLLDPLEWLKFAVREYLLPK